VIFKPSSLSDFKSLFTQHTLTIWPQIGLPYKTLMGTRWLAGCLDWTKTEKIYMLKVTNCHFCPAWM